MEIDLGQLLDTIPGLAWTALPDGNAEYVGKQWLEYTGLTFDRSIGAGWLDAIHPDDAPRLASAWNAIIASGRLGEVESRLRRRDGVYRWFLFRACPMHGPAGEITRWSGINFDIDDRVRAEESVRQHQSRLERILDGLPVNARLFSPAGKVIFCNRHCLEYFGATLEEMQADYIGRIHPDDRAATLEAWSAATRAGNPYDQEARLRRADGDYLWHRTLDFPLRNTQGEVELWYGLSIEIEHAKRAEAELAGEKRLLQMVAAGVPLDRVLDALCRQVEALAPAALCCVLMVEPDGKHFRFGAGPSIPPTYVSFMDGNTTEPSSGPCALAVSVKTPIVSANIARDPRWVSSPMLPLAAAHGLAACWSMPILATNGEACGVFAVYRREPTSATVGDFELIDRFVHIAGIAMERAQADAALKESQAELLQAHAHLNEAQRLSRTGSFTWDVERDEHHWSAEERRIWEFDQDVKISLQMILELVHPDDMPIAEKVIGGAVHEESFEVVLRIITRSGLLKHVHLAGRRARHISDRPVFLGAGQDITERKNAEEALGRARAELAHVSRAMTVSALTASIAHEVNQPLAGIITNANTGLRLLAADPLNLEGLRGTMQRTLRDGNRASEVIHRLRAMFAREPPGLERVDLNDAAREVLAMSAGELQQRRVILATDFADDLPAVMGDRVQLQQVILNLLLNAADAMSDIEDRPRNLYLMTAREGPDQIRLSVQDSGTGIEPEKFEQLFQAFYTTKPEGMGIGLAISRTIIEGHDGHIWAAPSERGPGATFSFRLPNRPATLGQTGRRAAETASVE